jgi:hypothetical protein
MLTHIVFIRFIGYESPEKEEITKTLKKKLDGLKKSVDAIVELETGININTRPSAYDLALVVKFENEDALNTYRTHPEHVKVLDYMKTLNIETGVVDYLG